MPTKPVLVTDTESPVPSLPSPHVQHATTYQNETSVRMAGFNSGIETLTAEMNGQHAAFEKEQERLKVEYERESKALTRSHEASKRDLLDRIDDMRTGQAMAAAALDVWNERNGKEGEANT